MELNGQIQVNRSPSEVFPLFAALERSGEYLDGFVRERITDDPIGMGTRWRAVDRWPGRTVEFTVELTEYEPDRSMAASWSEPMPGGWRATFASVGDGATDIRMQMEMHPSGLMGLLAPLMKPWANRQTTKFLTAFKDWAERQPTAAL